MTRDASSIAAPPPDAVGSIAVIRALALGDLLCAIPTIRALCARYSDANVSLIGLPWSRELIPRYAYLDEHLEFPGFPGIPEAPFDAPRTASFISEMQGRRFDLVVQLHGSGLWINAFAGLLGGRWAAGFLPPGIDDPGIVRPGTWIPYPEHGSEVRRLLALARALGAPTDERLEFPVTVRDREAATALLARAGSPGARYAVIHAGSSTPARRWPASHFAAISDRLSGVGFAIVLTGTAAEREVTSAVAREMQVEATDLAGRTDLGSLAGVLAGAELLVTNDTGVSHLAAAVGVRSVVVFSGSDAERWAPLDTDRHRTVLPNGDGDPAPVARAWEAVESLLAPAQMRVRQVAVS